MELDVREHAFLLSSHQIGYSFIRVKGLTNILFGGQGMYMDRFVTTGTPGLLILHGYGNVFERRLAAGESIIHPVRQQQSTHGLSRPARSRDPAPWEHVPGRSRR